jgi:hypothetical protein
MSSTHQIPGYSLNWAVSVYQAYLKLHARAANKVNKIYHVTPQMPPLWIARGGPRWRNYKKAVKVMEIWIITGVEPTTTQQLSSFRDHIGDLSDRRVIKRYNLE